MSRYILVRRLRGPLILLLIGVLALLYQAGAIPYFWRLFWPLLLIVVGLLLLAERAVLAAEGGYPLFPGAPRQGAQAGQPHWGGGNPSAGQGAPQSGASADTASSASRPPETGSEWNGGQS